MHSFYHRSTATFAATNRQSVPTTQPPQSKATLTTGDGRPAEATTPRISNAKETDIGAFEEDLPPPPPSRFLPEVNVWLILLYCNIQRGMGYGMDIHTNGIIWNSVGNGQNCRVAKTAAQIEQCGGPFWLFVSIKLFECFWVVRNAFRNFCQRNNG